MVRTTGLWAVFAVTMLITNSIYAKETQAGCSGSGGTTKLSSICIDNANTTPIDCLGMGYVGYFAFRCTNATGDDKKEITVLSLSSVTEYYLITGATEPTSPTDYPFRSFNEICIKNDSNYFYEVGTLGIGLIRPWRAKYNH